MNPFLEHVKHIASESGVSEAKVFASEVQRIFIEDFYSSIYSRGWALIGGANLKFLHGEIRCTKDIDFGATGNAFKKVDDVFKYIRLFEHILQNRIGFPVSAKLKEAKTAATIFINCPEIGGAISFDIEFTHFKILWTVEKARLGHTLVLGSSLKEMKVSKIMSLITRPKIETRDIFDIFVNPEPIDSELLEKYLKRYKKKKGDLELAVAKMEKHTVELNRALIERLKEDIGLKEAKRHIKSLSDTAIINQVAREIRRSL